jgi:hypothetical protein
LLDQQLHCVFLLRIPRSGELTRNVSSGLAVRARPETHMRNDTSYWTLAAAAGVTLACSSGSTPIGPHNTAGTGGVGGNGSVATAGASTMTGAGTSSVNNPTAGSSGSGPSTAGGAAGNATAGAGGNAGSTTAGSPGVTAGTGGNLGNGGTGGVASAGAAGTGGSGTGMVPGETKPTVTAPASSKVPKDYFVLGEARLINNNWGAQELGCNAPYEIFVSADKSFGWKWDRNTVKCGGNKSKPDYPEVEFGMHPFGVSTQLITSPDYSSTTILPIQIKDVTSASVKIEGLSIATTADAAWNMNFEMWFCEQHPATGTHTTAYGETMNWFGWSSDQYNWAGVLGSLEAGQSYDLMHSDDHWPAGQAQQWKYRQYRLKSSSKQFNGTVDVKKILTALTGQGWPSSLWIARFEVGTELDDGSAGTVTMKKITFEVNGQQRATEVR